MNMYVYVDIMCNCYVMRLVTFKLYMFLLNLIADYSMMRSRLVLLLLFGWCSLRLIMSPVTGAEYIPYSKRNPTE